MKIKVSDLNIERLKELKKSIDKFLKIYNDNLEFSEKVLSDICESAKDINHRITDLARFSKIYVSIVNSDGKEFTML